MVNALSVWRPTPYTRLGFKSFVSVGGGENQYVGSKEYPTIWSLVARLFRVEGTSDKPHTYVLVG